MERREHVGCFSNLFGLSHDLTRGKGFGIQNQTGACGLKYKMAARQSLPPGQVPFPFPFIEMADVNVLIQVLMGLWSINSRRSEQVKILDSSEE